MSRHCLTLYRRLTCKPYFDHSIFEVDIARGSEVKEDIIQRENRKVHGTSMNGTTVSSTAVNGTAITDNPCPDIVEEPCSSPCEVEMQNHILICALVKGGSALPQPRGYVSKILD